MLSDKQSKDILKENFFFIILFSILIITSIGIKSWLNMEAKKLKRDYRLLTQENNKLKMQKEKLHITLFKKGILEDFALNKSGLYQKISPSDVPQIIYSDKPNLKDHY